MKICPLCQEADATQERILNDFRLLRCTRCRFVYADMDDGLIEESNSQIFGDCAVQGYDSAQTLLDDLWFRRIAARFTRLLGPGRILDIGCGNGLLLKQFKALGWQCYGTDTSPWSRPYAERYGFTFFEREVQHLSSDVGELDLVTSSSCLEHVAQPLSHIRAILKVLKRGGVGYFCGMPNYGAISIRLNLSDFYMNTPPAHVNYFTSESLVRLFRAAGIPRHNIKVRAYGIPGAHKIYNKITGLLRANRHGAVGEGQRAGLEKKPITSTGKGNVFKRKLGELLLNIYYNAGRVGGFGDKLEAVIVSPRCNNHHEFGV